MWQELYYEELLQEWANLRERCSSLPLTEALKEINDWWYFIPSRNQYYHLTEEDSWPTPWEILQDGSADDVAKCLGICYTILLLNREDITEFLIVQGDHVFVRVNNQYYLNYDFEDLTISPDCDYSIVFDCKNLKLK